MAKYSSNPEKETTIVDSSVAEYKSNEEDFDKNPLKTPVKSEKVEFNIKLGGHGTNLAEQLRACSINEILSPEPDNDRDTEDDVDADALKNIKEISSGVSIIWEVTFDPGENALSANATMYAYELDAIERRILLDQKSFKQSIRNGLKEIVHSMGFALTTSRSAYFAAEASVADISAAKIVDALGQVVNNEAAPERNLGYIRARNWLTIVLAGEADCRTASPAHEPETRNATTPLLILESKRVDTRALCKPHPCSKCLNIS